MYLEFDGFSWLIDKKCVEDALFIVVSGSHACGWNTAKSDLDVRRVYFPDIKQALSVFYRCRTKEHKHKTERGIIDTTEYPIQNFIGLLAKGNGNAVDNLFEADPDYPPYPKLHVDAVKVKQLQQIVLENLHKGFLMHCLGYDMSIAKDMLNPTRLQRYGEYKLLLNRYKILLQGLILAEHGKVVYNIIEQQKYRETNWCLELLDDYQQERPRDTNFERKELEQLHAQLAECIKTINWPDAHQSPIDLALEHWLVNYYIP